MNVFLDFATRLPASPKGTCNEAFTDIFDGHSFVHSIHKLANNSQHFILRHPSVCLLACLILPSWHALGDTVSKNPLSKLIDRLIALNLLDVQGASYCRGKAFVDRLVLLLPCCIGDDRRNFPIWCQQKLFCNIATI